MRFTVYIGCLLLPAVLGACRTGPAEPHPAMMSPRFDRMSFDSVKSVLNTQELTVAKQIEGNGDIGFRYFLKGEYDSARLYFNRVLALPGGREEQGGRFLVNLANTYGFEGRYAEALEYYMEALQVAERMAATREGKYDGESNIVRTAANLAEVHYLMGNRQQALRYARLGKELFDRLGQPNTLYIVPQLLYVAGSVYLEQGEWDAAEAAMRETRELADSLSLRDAGNAGGSYWYVAYGLEGLAQVALARKDYAQALEYAAQALDYAERHGDPTVTAKMLSAFSDIHRAQGDHEASERFARQALELFPDYRKLNPGVLFNIASARLFAGDAEGAYDDFRRYAEQMRVNTDKQFRETMAGMEVVHETEKKEARIAVLEKQRLLYSLAGLAGVLFVVALWIVFRQKIRQERQEKQLVAANAILDWEKRERKRFAGDLHDGINGMLSAVKLQLGTTNDRQSIRGQLDDCIETIRRMSRGLMPGSLERYGLKAALEDYCRLFPNVDFHFYGAERRMDESLELTVYYCAYELVNNSFRHSGARHIHVQLVQDDGSVSLTVQDDGCGFDPRRANGGGSGLKNIRDRIAAFNGKMDIASSPGEGTEITIEIITN